MKRFVLFSVMSICLFINLIAQNTDKKQHLPEEDSRVTREYDEKGNLTKFDSVYTYSWSNDSAFQKSFSPKDFPEMFGDNFGFFADSTFKGNSFFGDFDRMFTQPFNGTRDSVLMNQFDHFQHFKDFYDPNDSIALNFDDFFGQMRPNKSDSISSKSPHHSLGLQPKSMEDMMKMMQQRMIEMEEMQRKFFEEHQNSKNQPKLKEF